jgi:hypothetical protein
MIEGTSRCELVHSPYIPGFDACYPMIEGGVRTGSRTIPGMYCRKLTSVAFFAFWHVRGPVMLPVGAGQTGIGC